MSKQRKDNKGRVLRTGEAQLNDRYHRFVFRYTENGKQKAIYSLSLPELREKEEEIKRNLADGISTTGGNTTINDLWERFIASRSNTLKDSTLTLYHDFYNLYIRDTIGNRKIAAVKYSDVHAFFNDLLVTKGLSKSTVGTVKTLLFSVFRLACRDGILRYNPIGDAYSEATACHRTATEKRHALTPQEQEHFFDYCNNSEFAEWSDFFTALLQTGMRIGEAIGLTWSDIDFKGSAISVNHTTTYDKFHGESKYTFHINTTKTAAGTRQIPMTSTVKHVLLGIREEQLAHGTSDLEINGYKGFVFLNCRGNLHEPGNTNHVISRIVKAYNAQETEQAKEQHREPELIRPFSCHSLRHTFATRLCQSTTDLKAIQAIMGHSNISLTMNVYAEATAEATHEAINSVEQAFSKIV